MGGAVTMTGEEAIATGKRLIGAVEAQMMATDPHVEPFALMLLQAERTEALALLEKTQGRARSLRQAAAVPGTNLHAKWQQTKLWRSGWAPTRDL
jgi:hypothetical protein